ncbi:DoxX family protein [Flavobacterium sp. JP2137]|uniref:DoxX family protein n=1 Tax=Flavobacterium sp. JP2137 TaxID=3414510 RepID=UPI003D2FA8EE
MKKLFSTDYNDCSINAAFLILRVGIGALMLTHGLPKLALIGGDSVQFATVFGLSAEISLSLAVFAEVICSVLLIVGLGTRLATIPLITTMLIAVFYIHGDSPFAKKEIGIIYLLIYVVLLITGPGKYSLDQLLCNKKTSL